MPCLEITLPASDPESRARLAEALTAAFVRSTGFEREIFGIHFREYAPGEAAVGGRLCGLDGPAYLHLLLFCPRLRRTQKQRVVAEFTGAFEACLGTARGRPVVHIAEHPYDNVGVEGSLLSDRYEALAQRDFYFPLPRD